MVPFALGDAWFAVDIRRVREIVRVPDIGRGSDAVTYRGEVVRLWWPPRPAGASPRVASVNNRILFLDLGQRIGALIVDRVGEVIRVDPSAVLAPSMESSGFAPGVVRGQATVGGRRVSLIDPVRLIASLPAPASPIAA